MADYYVRSTDGSNSDDGSTWALAKADLHTPTWAAGDRIYVSGNHAQTTAAAIAIATAGTIARPTQIICGGDDAEPPTSESSAATVTTTGNSPIAFTGSAFIQGVAFYCGTGGTGTSIQQGNTAGAKQTFRDCVFRLNATGGTARIKVVAS